MQNVDRPNSRTNGVDTVSWQDEQRKLQEQYDRGEISAQEFRTRRQALLSAATAAQQAAPNAPGSDATQTMRPAQPPQAEGQHSERAQAVPPAPGHDAGRTQVVSGGAWQAPQPPPGVYGYGPQQPQQGGGHEAPPWSGSEFPPLVAPGSDQWSTHGSAAFARPKGNKGKIVALVVAVVALAGLGVGGYFLWGRGGAPQASPRGSSPAPTSAGTNSQAAPSPAASKPPKLFPVGDMPVKPDTRRDVTSVAQFASLHYFTDAELAAYTDAGARKAKMAVFKVGGDTLVTLIFAQADNPQAAYTAAKKLNAIQIHNGRTENPDEPAGVRVAEIEANPDMKQPAGIRAHYSHGRVIVRVDVKGASLDGLTPTFNTVLAAELKVLAPDA